VQNDGIFVGRDLNVFTREEEVELLFESQRPLIDDHVVLLAAVDPQMIKLTVPGPLPSMSTSRGWTHDGVGHGRIGDGDAV